MVDHLRSFVNINCQTIRQHGRTTGFKPVRSGQMGRVRKIAGAAIGTVEAGAAIIHRHARHPGTGQPDQSPEAFGAFLRRITQN